MNRLTPAVWTSFLFALPILFVARQGSAQSCTVPAQCTQLDAPVCTALGVCTPCLANYQTGGAPPGCPNASAPYCQASDAGPLGGACTQCGPGAGNAGLCDTTHPVCLASGQCGCTTSTECPSGFACDTATKACVSEPDAGSDAGSSSSNDAGSDAGHDAGSVDSGAPSDGGQAPHDAGVADAGHDASVIDAASDASLPEEDAAVDGSVTIDGAAPADASSPEGDDAETDGPANDAGNGDEDVAEAGIEGAGNVVEGGGCACTTGQGGGADGVLGALGLLLVFAATRKKPGRGHGGAR